ncbi:uncharacterized protein LOC128559174 [Mercenaria mercenaria]|uniref:uncharacterized protein LOC128559174 n=1 Tax=Mercenaria mercenaria TaxID=6596 RepID=UPI00234F2723|nr:uncharacterized protein LOC128559174 [Mercenaria mercenaria]
MYAVFGDSYISRLDDYTTRGNRDLRHNYKFYGVPGMSTQRKMWNKFYEMVADKPRYVFINLGGNDILDKVNIDDILDNLGKVEGGLRILSFVIHRCFMQTNKRM